MRGEDQRSEGFFSYVRLDTRIPVDHPLRAIRALADEALSGLSRKFDRLYSRDGRPSIPPERLHAARLAEQCQPPLRDRRTHDPPSRLSHQHHQA